MTVNIPIFLASDNNYAPFVATAIASICDNTNSYCEFYVLDGGISEENKARICDLKNQFDNFSVVFVKIDTDKYFKNFIVESYITVATYYRFVIADLFPDLEKVLYLDVDIIAQGDISDLYNIDLANYVLGAVIDQGDKLYISRLKKNLNMDIFSHYFNAGVLLIDLKKWREDNISKKLFETEKKYRGNLLCNDQDVLNKLFENNYKELPICFNSMLTNKNAIVRHFYNKVKPWHVAEDFCLDEYKDFLIFWFYAKLIGISDRIDCKYKSKHQFQVLNLYKRQIKKNLSIPKVSIIIPIYNVESYLRRCLDSVINQTLGNIEIICVNDCSTDNSWGILQEYAKNDNRIRLINFAENKGAAAARNAGIEEATGEYIGFVDSDDFVDLDFYEKLYVKAKETDADIVKGKIVQYLENGNVSILPWDDNDNIREHKAFFIYGFTTALYRLKLVLDNNIRFPVSLVHLEDPYFLIQCVNLCNKMEFCDRSFYYYRHNVSSITHNLNMLEYEKSAYAVLKLINSLSLSEEDYLIIYNHFFTNIIDGCEFFLQKDENLKFYSRMLVYYIENSKYKEKTLFYFYKKKQELLKKDRLNLLRKQMGQKGNRS